MKPATMNQPLCPSATVSNQRSRSSARAFRRTFGTLKLYAERWSRRYRLRNSLYEMDTRLIEKDIGVPYGSLFEEAHKPFWRE